MDNLLNDIEAFLKRHDMKPSAFGQMAIRDRHLVFQLRDGREPRSAVVAKIRGYMTEKEQVAA